MASAELNTPKMVRWNGGRRLALLLPAIIVMVALTSSTYEFWLEDPIYSHYGWPLDETLNEKLRYVVQAVGFTSVAVIGPGILLFRSLAQLRRAHEQLQRAFHVAQSANTAKSQFLANMSHEQLRTPLNAVIGFADIMQAEMFGPLLPRYREYVSDVRNAGLHLLDVINDVLDISKAEAAEISIQQSDIELAGIFEELEMLARGLAAEACVALRFELESPSGTIMVRGDRVRLKQSLLNLVSNGIKFNRSGGSVTVRAFVEADAVRIEIRDTGIGMRPDQIADAFQPFVQLHTGHARKYEGTGLGLPLTKILIEAMNGSIAVQSEEDVGTCIVVKLSPGTSNEAASAA